MNIIALLCAAVLSLPVSEYTSRIAPNSFSTGDTWKTNIDGVTFEVMEPGTIHVSGTAESSDVYNVLKLKNPTSRDTQYVLDSGLIESAVALNSESTRLNLCISESGDGFSKYVPIGESRLIDSWAEYSYCRISIAWGDTVDFVIHPVLTEYHPYAAADIEPSQADSTEEYDSVLNPSVSERPAVNTPGPIKVQTLDEWVDAVHAWCNLMIQDRDWTYSNGRNNITDYKAARSANKRVTNCALMVTHALQYAGLFATDMKVWGKNDGKLAYSDGAKERLASIATIIHFSDGEKKSSEFTFKTGDIVTYYNQHTNIYAGKNLDRGKMWFDAGKETTREKKYGSGWDSFMSYGCPNAFISNVIRLNLPLK